MEICRRCGSQVDNSASACSFCGEIIDDNNWTEVTDSDDVEVLLSTFGGFHDSCIKELHMWTGHFVDPDLSMRTSGDLDCNVRILCQRQWENPSAVELWFEEVTELHVSPSPLNYDSIILEATLEVNNGSIYWADDGDWSPGGDGNEKVTWIASRKLRWRDVSSWMGAAMRYGAKK